MGLEKNAGDAGRVDASETRWMRKRYRVNFRSLARKPERTT